MDDMSFTVGEMCACESQQTLLHVHAQFASSCVAFARQPQFEMGRWEKRPRANSTGEGARARVDDADDDSRGKPGSIYGAVAPGFSRVGIVPYDAAGRRVFSGISRFPGPCIPALLHAHLASSSSALKALMLRAAQMSSLTLSKYNTRRRTRGIRGLGHDALNGMAPVKLTATNKSVSMSEIRSKALMFKFGIVPDDAAGRRVFSGISRSPGLSFRLCSILTSVTLIGSQDLADKSSPNLFTRSLRYDGGSTHIPSSPNSVALQGGMAINQMTHSRCRCYPSPRLLVRSHCRVLGCLAYRTIAVYSLQHQYSLSCGGFFISRWRIARARERYSQLLTPNNEKRLDDASHPLRG
ncbi:hypothetical protein PR048_020417 [Dryococelus australis]|uniref:Uncharacterized protein n=1 Tax=Dryococelus australis TaxID=614101 RepID=A0ABQ9H6A4_9NEOP|nr:hypothetical protein PR048_020417 [Dryococelus australis]